MPIDDAFLGKPLEVVPRKDESIDRLLKRFAKKVRNEGILQLFVEKSRYEKPSNKKKKKRSKKIS